MDNTDYHIEIETGASPERATAAINEVAIWWGADLDGASEKIGDQFTIHFGATFVDFQVTDIVPGETVVWRVTDCGLPWLNDRKEWLNHKLIFEINKTTDGCRVSFTQIGLTPAQECYDGCEKGWNFYIGESLKALLDTGAGKPDTKRSERVAS